ncbi:hypothetical protein ACHAQK_006819 [Fusarium lateritium]
MYTSTTFRYDSDPEKLDLGFTVDPSAPFDSHGYSRYTAPNTTRLEAILSAYLKGPSLTYASGLAAFHALKLKPLEILTHSDEDLARLQKGDILHTETPFNPTGEAIDLGHYRRIATGRGAWLTCDATLAPPPLQDPFALGVDIVMHSGTKYIGGHSDLLCGVLSVRPDIETSESWIDKLRGERVFLGSVMGSLEGWLGVRSIRTLELRVERQARSAESLINWLATSAQEPGPVGEVVAEVQHASLQPEATDETSWLRKQMPNGYGGVFALLMKDKDLAKRLPSNLHLFHHATSLGGVESLIEWRAISDKSIDRRLLRVNIGVEHWEDLKADLLQAFKALRR